MTAMPESLKSAVSCPQCRRLLVRTVSGWWSCPMSHGKLLTVDVVEERILAALKANPSLRITVPTVLRRLERLERNQWLPHAFATESARSAPVRPKQAELTGLSS